MERLVYDLQSKKIIDRILDCEGTATGTPYEMVEGTTEQIDELIDSLGLAAAD